MNSSTSAPPESQPQLSPGRVLVVDDVPANVRLLAGILKIEGFDIVTAQSGPDALELLESGADVDVVLLDVMMPGMDGFEVCARIRQNAALGSLPVVMVTALRDTPDRVRALEVGADDFLTKPVEETEVVARVRSLVRAKRDRQALTSAYRDLQAAEELRNFLAQMLVHDLRTPLTTVLASLEMLQTGMAGALSPAQQEITAMSVQGGQHLLSLVNELLDISKLEGGEMRLQLEEIEVASLLRSAVDHIEGQARYYDTFVEIEAAEGLPLLRADADLLGRVFINLLGNAIKFGRHQTPVRARVELEEDGATAMLFAIEDDGEGIAVEDQERIFSKFAQAENRRAKKRSLSTGLGLTFCKLAVEAHGGRIWVESELGRGSTFWVRIPLQLASAKS